MLQCIKTLKWLRCLALTLCLFSSPGQALQRDQILVDIGTELFPATLNAIDSPTINADQTAQILIVYKQNSLRARQVKKRLHTILLQHGTNYVINSIHIDQLVNIKSTSQAAPVRGMFIIEAIDRGIESLVAFCVSNHCLSFSPFQSHVKSGVSAGVSVSDTIKPLLNTSTLNNSGITLKTFFLDVSKKIESDNHVK